MKLVFIRHGDPDYARDSLTEKGWREAELLRARVCQMQVRDFYCSPLGRAQDTARVSLDALRRSAVTLDWLREFPGYVLDEATGKRRIPWDFMPGDWTKKYELYDKCAWLESPIMQTGDVPAVYARVCTGIDTLLSEYGYHRDGNFYRTEQGNTDTLVFFCHLGVQFAILSHLLGIAPTLLWQGFFVAPTSVTMLASEERRRGEVYFRTQMLGDISHLYAAQEPMSLSGFFEETYSLKKR